MRGETGLLVLASPLMWWPSAEELHRHPLDARRTFFSTLTSAGVAVGAEDRAVALSRLGTSIMQSGTIDGSSVRVYNPFAGAEITLAVRGEAALSSGASLRALVEADRVRIEAAAVEKGVVLRPLAEDASVLGERHAAAGVRHVLHYLQLARQSGVCSVLFTGENGVGKTHTVQRIAKYFPPVVDVNGVQYVVERRNVVFAQLLQMNEQEAVTTIRCAFATPPIAPSNGNFAVVLLLTLDGIELLWASSNSLVDLVSHQLCAVLEELDSSAVSSRPGSTNVVVLATATSTSSLPTALLARLSSRVVHVVPPSLEERQRYVEMQSGCFSFSHDVRMQVAESLAGQTASQLAALQKKGNMLQQMLEREAASTLDGSQLEKSQRAGDGKEKEENFGVYRGLIGVDDVIRDLEEFVVWPLLHLRLLRRCGVMTPKGVLVCGPSGSGKTALLTALARRLRSKSTRGVHVMLVDGLSLIEKEVGRTEKNIAALFSAARAMSPTALFLDNIDSLAPPRRQQTTEVSNAADRTLSTLLTEMDGITNGNNDGDVVFVVASSPHFTSLDPAISRPGRLDLHLKISPPTREELHQHIVQRVMACVMEFALGNNNTGDEAAMLTLVREHVWKWMDSGHLSVARANAFAREVLLHMVEALPHVGEEQLRQSLEKAVSV